MADTELTIQYNGYTLHADMIIGLEGGPGVSDEEGGGGSTIFGKLYQENEA